MQVYAQTYTCILYAVGIHNVLVVLCAVCHVLCYALAYLFIRVCLCHLAVLGVDAVHGEH